MTWLWITLALIALAILSIVRRLFTYLPRARRDLSTLRPGDIASLSSECERTFETAFHVSLAAMPATEAVATLDEHLRRRDFWEHFRQHKQPGWRYARVVGCHLGELIRRETGASWNFRADEPPVLELRRGEASFMADPFERVLRHHMQGDEGDLSAWFQTLQITARRIQSENA